MSSLVPPAPRIALVDGNGRITRPWSLYFQELYARVGGTVGPSNADLQDQIDAIDLDSVQLGVFGRTIAPVLSPPDMGYITAFLGRQRPDPSPDNASAVLCNRVFAKR